MENLRSVSRNEVVRSTSDFVYNTVRQAILTNEYPAGSRLVEAKISKELNVSITPVREAFAKLANRGLLTVFPYKGTYVTIMSREYFEDVYFLRKRLEVMASEKGFHKLTEEDIAYLEQLCAISDVAYDRKDLYESIRCDVLFHEHMFTVSGSNLLMETWNIIKYRIENIQAKTKPVMNARMSQRHKPMLDALRSRDQQAYVDALLDHLTTTVGLTYFPEEKDVRYE